MSNRRYEHGFTLIELLIVVVVLGILAGIVIYAAGNSRGDAKASACSAEKAAVETALETYKAKNGAYASDQAALVSGGYLKSAASHVSGWDASGIATTTDCA
jgi:type II secretion system protein G